MEVAPFRFQLASDVIRDGLGVELLDHNHCVLAEIFRCDRDHTLTISLFTENLPFAAIEMLIDRAKLNLDPFEDGTPLSSVMHAKS